MSVKKLPFRPETQCLATQLLLMSAPAVGASKPERRISLFVLFTEPE